MLLVYYLFFLLLFVLFLFFFFFSSRRRHTRSLCDWSSDVCSSDLALPVFAKRSSRVRIGILTYDSRERNRSWPRHFSCPPSALRLASISVRWRSLDRKSVV